MNLSQRAIVLCRMKYGKGVLLGFENLNNDILNDLTEKEEENVIREMAEAELLESTDEDIHLGALAHHLLNMMIEPDQLIRIENDSEDIAVSVYIRNTYYLCVIDNKKITRPDDPHKYMIELLPRIDLIVGAFTYALGSNTEKAPDKEGGIKIAGRAWDKDRKVVSELSLSEADDDYTDISSMINNVTMWMLNNIAASAEADIVIEEQSSEDSEGHEVTKW